MNTIKIINGKINMLLPLTNGFLNVVTFKKYYPTASGLKYKKNGVNIRILFGNKDDVEVDTQVEMYEPYIAEGNQPNEIDDYLDKKIVKYFHVNYEYKDICNLLKVKHNCQISLRKLKRLLKKKCLKRENMDESPIEEIISAIYIELENSGYNLGYRALCQRLQKEYGLIIKRDTVLRILQIVDPIGIENRKKRKLRRRMYTVPGPNFLWHIDGYDKIKRYGFAIHGCIDGYSKKLLWLEVSNSNNDPEIIAHYYLQTVLKYRCVPTLIRSDKGTENSIVENLQQCLRSQHDDQYAGENSFPIGKSTANQRIESSWYQLRKHVTGFYIDLFKKLEEKNMLDISNKLHIQCLRFCFYPLIKHDLKHYKREWNEHRIRKQNCRNIPGGKPNIMYYLPQKFGAEEYKKNVNEKHVKILQKYAKEPQFVNPEFHNVMMEEFPNLSQPCTAEDSCNLYLQILDYIDIL